jgi:predicted XRE-type DNA-binding protein
MQSAKAVRFDANALHAALDAERRSRGMSWRQVSQAIGVSTSTLANTAKGDNFEADGIVTMLCWLGMPVEAFVIPHGVVAVSKTTQTRGGVYLTRVDTRALYAALDGERRARDMSWDQLAVDSGVPLGGGAVRRLGEGGRTEVNTFVRLVAWLGVPAEAFLVRPGAGLPTDTNRRPLSDHGSR